MTDHVRPDSLVTLHYRVTTADDTEVVSTFGMTPTTLQLGNFELAPTLEACLHGLSVGERKTFLLEAGQAFGPLNPDLQQRMPLSDLPDHGQGLARFDLIEFETRGAHGGAKYAGTVRAIDADGALIDFNHPLAGQAIRFEVEIVGIL